ncbi:hypothetical protein [Aggregatibacter actinomycetemcomitans]|uniref:hypothetical protein n=1 Tax=Aggregatibacter actinomycetemcomitans TaxID=714 RepID=UPI001F11CDE9|nr:hypothetical protein [Aggregatibacter actinomycetemcomitans]
MSERIKRHIASRLNFVNDNVVEIARPLSSILSTFIYTLIFIIIIFISADVFMPSYKEDPLRDSFDAWVNPENLDQRKYESYISYSLYRKAELEQKIKESIFTDYVEKELAKLKIPTLEEYKNKYPDRNERYKIWGFIYYILPIILILINWLIPESRPIRLDRRNGIIYFKSWWKYFIYRIPMDSFEQSTPNEMHIGLSDILPLQFNIGSLAGGFIALHSADHKSIITREIWVGKDEDEKDELEKFLTDYFHYKEDPKIKAYSQKKVLCKRIFSFHFFSLSYNEKKTEKFIQDYLDKYGHLVLTKQEKTPENGLRFVAVSVSNFSTIFSNTYRTELIETKRITEEEQLWQRLQKALKGRVFRRYIIMAILMVIRSVAVAINRRRYFQ